MALGFEESRTPFDGPTQNARVWTEQWVRRWLFCPNCGAANVEPYERNRPVADFHCGACREDYELKSQKGRFGAKVVDGAFGTMCARLAADDNPNLILMNYDLAGFGVTDVFVVPKHFFVRDIIEERKPLAPTARRAGWAPAFAGVSGAFRNRPRARQRQGACDPRDRAPVPRAEVLAQPSAAPCSCARRGPTPAAG